jgi:hypothetical protein
MCTRAVDTPIQRVFGTMDRRHSAVDSSPGNKQKLRFSRLADNDTLLGLIRRTLLFLIKATAQCRLLPFDRTNQLTMMLYKWLCATYTSPLSHVLYIMGCSFLDSLGPVMFDLSGMVKLSVFKARVPGIWDGTEPL